MSYWKKRRDAFGYAFKGIIRLIKGEPHAKIHLLATICVIIFGLIYHIKPWEWCVVLLCIGAVLAAESFNTAIEKLADRVTRERDPMIAASKDIASGAVLILALTSVVVGLIVFVPYILSSFRYWL